MNFVGEPATETLQPMERIAAEIPFDVLARIALNMNRATALRQALVRTFCLETASSARRQGALVNGTFNGLPLEQITAIRTTTEASGFRRNTFRVLGRQPKLEQILQLGVPALLILSNQEIEGKVVQYRADVHVGYEITIESRG